MRGGVVKGGVVSGGGEHGGEEHGADQQVLKVAYLGSSASPHNQRWASYLAEYFNLRLFTLEEADIDGVDVHHFRRPTGTALDYVLVRSRVERAIKEFQPDIIHAHRITSYGYIGASIARAFRRSGATVPFILSVWGEDVFSFPRKSQFHRRFSSWVLETADQILSTSHVMRDETLRYVSPRWDIQVTPFGVDTAQFVPAETTGPADTAIEADSRQKTVVVGTVKKLRDRYGVDVLIRAIAVAAERLAPDISLRGVIVGEGPQRQELEELAASLGMKDEIHFVGRIDHADVPKTLAGLDVFAALSVSDDESFGVAMVEGSAMALPVLSTRVGGIPEVVLHEETGLLVPPGDVEAAAEAIVRLATDQEYRVRLGRRGRAFVQARYDWNSTAARMTAIYRDVYERSRK